MSQLRRLTVAQAAAEWGGIYKETVRLWVEKDILPPGYIGKCMKGKGRNTYYIWEVNDEGKSVGGNAGQYNSRSDPVGGSVRDTAMYNS